MKYIIFLIILCFGSGIFNGYQLRSVNPPIKVKKLKQVQPVRSILPKQKNEILVMVMDTGIAYHDDLKDYVKYDGSSDYIDNYPSGGRGHGTHVAGIIALGPNMTYPLCKQVQIISCKVFEGDNSTTIEKGLTCLKRAIDLKVDYINYSGGNKDVSFREYQLLKKLEKMGTKVIAALGNNNEEVNDYNYYFPASYALGFKYMSQSGTVLRAPPLSNITMVQASCNDGTLCDFSNRNPSAITFNGDEVRSTFPDNKYAKWKGTSQAAPGYLHTILRRRCNDFNLKVYESTEQDIMEEAEREGGNK